MQGKLLFSGAVIVDPVQATISEDPPHRVPRGWRGVLRLPAEHRFSFWHHKLCELVLEDGRRGEIIPEVFKPHEGSFTFTGTGALTEG